jgi:hypothetical protein
MKKIIYAFIFSLCLPVAFLAGAPRAEAVLGETAQSIENDQKVLSGQRHSASVRNGYTVHEIDSGSTVVREYISPSGIVFAVAWNGLTHPDLTQLLGSYAGEYQEAFKRTAPKHGQRRIQIKTNRIVVEKWGHMRNLQGRAYVQELIPAGVNIEKIR